MVAGKMAFLMAGGISYDLAEIDAPAGRWTWLAGAGVLLAVAGFLAVLVLVSNVLIRRERKSILPTTTLRTK